MSFDIDRCAYRYLSGPVETEEELQQGFAELNCRRATQYYFWKIHRLFLPPTHIQMPEAYRNIGTFISQGSALPLSEMNEGDIIYAQNIVAKSGGPLQRDRHEYANEEAWLMHLHTAIYLGPSVEHTMKQNESNALLWHASHFSGGVCTWTIEHFREYYTPVAVKRLLLDGTSISEGTDLIKDSSEKGDTYHLPEESVPLPDRRFS